MGGLGAARQGCHFNYRVDMSYFREVKNGEKIVS